MAGPKKQQTEAGIMENSETKLHKKHKNKQKRKIEEIDAEDVEIEKKVEEETLDAGSSEISKKKKKKNKDKEGEGGDGASEGKAATEEVIESSGVVVSGKNVNESKYKALNSFHESGLPGEVLECCKAFDKPSPIQSHSWPFLLDGRDLIGIAATGSGMLFIVCSLSNCFMVWLSCVQCF